MKIFLKLRKKTSNTKKGFTLVELLVVFFIMASILAVVIPGYLEYSSKLDFDNLALDVALAVREAQVYGAGAKVSTVTPDKFDAKYGIHFDIDNKDRFIFFEDSGVSSLRYDAGDNILNTYILKQGYSIFNLCGSKSGGGITCIEDYPAPPAAGSLYGLDIIYQRPNPTAALYIRNPAGSNLNGGAQDSVYIEIISPDLTIATTSISQSGRISIK